MKRSLLLLACVALAACSAGPSKPNSATVIVGRIGAPGSPPPTKTMAVAQYGSFAYASEENYCNASRWVISGTLLPEYANDPHPVAVKRGTRARLIERIRTDCASHGGNDIQDTTLVHVDLLDGKYAGQDRYVLPGDWYTEADYAKFKRDKASEQNVAVAYKKRVAATYAAMEKKSDGCAKPAEDADAAGGDDWNSAFQKGYDLASQGLVLNESCKSAGSRLMNEGFLMSWKAWAERHTGSRSQAEMDLREADALLRKCTRAGADNNSDLSCDVERTENEYMMDAWKNEDRLGD